MSPLESIALVRIRLWAENPVHPFRRCIAHLNVLLSLRPNVRLWPKAAPRSTVTERPLLGKADTQIAFMIKTQSERLLHPRKQPLACYSLGGCL
jgi:hypothetical protein